MREVRRLELGGWCRRVFGGFPFHNYSTRQRRALSSPCLLFSLSLKHFVTTCAGLRSAADQHDPLSASVPLSLRSIYCTSGNAAELNDVAPGRSPIQATTTAIHSDSVHTSRGEMGTQIPLCCIPGDIHICFVSTRSM